MNSVEWTLWTAATMTQDQNRDALISSVHLRAGDTQKDGLFPLSYLTNTGESNGGEGSPAFGAMFAPMALHLPVWIESGTQSGRTTTDDGGSGTSNVGAIAGGVLGGVVTVVSISLAVFFWRRREQKKTEEEKEETEPSGFPAYEYPFVAALPREKRGFISHAQAPVVTQGSLPPRDSRKRGRNNAPAQPQITTPQPSSVSNELASSSNPEPTNDVNLNIQIEVEQLRRDVEEIRASGIDAEYEPPPQYQTQ
jgi:hypothetical protein